MLTDTVIRAAKASDRPRKLFDEKGLFLLVTPSGSRLWRFKYRFPRSGPAKKEKLLALGTYPYCPETKSELAAGFTQPRDSRSSTFLQVAGGD
jgi:Arm DNA-binding domain